MLSHCNAAAAAADDDDDDYDYDYLRQGGGFCLFVCESAR